MTPVADATRWYRLPLMWLVVALPLLAFLGGGLMLGLAILRPDPEVHSEHLLESPPPAALP